MDWELGKAIKTIEDAGGFVMLPNSEEAELIANKESDDAFLKMEQEQLRIKNYNKSLRISVAKACELHDFDMYDMSSMMDSVVPACCDAGCEVEPDGRCEHGHPSILLAMGML